MKVQQGRTTAMLNRIRVLYAKDRAGRTGTLRTKGMANFGKRYSGRSYYP